MQAFNQGRVDNFCAIYAVLNALQVLYGINVLEARTIFNRTLLRHSHDSKKFAAILNHKTDYVALVDSMLDDVRLHDFPSLNIEAPFASNAPCSDVWEKLRMSASPPMPLVSVFRFLRFSPGSRKPYADHWTAGHYMDMDGLHFLDCSQEPGALYCLPHAQLTDASHPLAFEYVVIPPQSVRILSVVRSASLPS
mgnify:CR=1 FL=1